MLYCNRIDTSEGIHPTKIPKDFKQICDKDVDTHPSTIQFIPECYKTQEMCYLKQLIDFFVFDSIPGQYKIQEICDIVVSLYPF